jgi:glucose/arabinose dehydrogenase
MNSKFYIASVVVLTLAVASLFMVPVHATAQGGGAAPAIALEKISLPPGFQIEVFAEGLQAARQMALADDGTVFVGSFGLFTGAPELGNIYAIRDTDRDGRADEVMTILSGLTVPNGVAFRDGALFVAENNRITRYNNILSDLGNPPDAVVLADMPVNGINHSWK